MSNTVKHTFVSAVADSADTSIVRPSDWNHEHTFAGGGLGQFLQYSGSASDKVRWHDFPGGTDVTLFGAVPNDPGTNSRSAIQAAFASSKHILFPEGDYYLGTYTSSTKIFDLSSYGDGLRIYTQGKVTFHATASGSNVTPFVFYFANNNDFYCEPVYFEGTGYNDATTTGICPFYLDNSGQTSWGNFTFEHISAHNAFYGVLIAGGSDTDRTHNIRIHSLIADDCYYGLNCQNDGDDIVATIVSNHCHRPYFPWGVSSHIINVFNSDPRPGTGQCNIARLVGGRDTRGITLNYVCRNTGNAVTVRHVNIQHTDLLGGEISGLKIHVDIKDTIVPYYPVYFVNYTGSGGSETAAASSNIVRDVQLSGSCDANAYPVTAVATYASKRQLHFISGYFFLPAASMFTAFQFSQLGRGGTTINWKAETTAPALGNGILSYNLEVINGLVSVDINLTIGSTSTMGTGGWIFDGFLTESGLTGVAATATRTGSWVGVAGGVYFVGTCRIQSGSDDVQCFYNNSGTAVKVDLPVVWAAGDTLTMSLIFPIS